MAANFAHDVYRILASQNITVASAQGAASSTGTVSAQTYFLRLAVEGAITSTSGVRYIVGDSPVATSTSVFLPCAWVEFVKCTPGQRVSAIGNDSVAPGRLNIVELTD